MAETSILKISLRKATARSHLELRARVVITCKSVDSGHDLVSKGMRASKEPPVLTVRSYELSEGPTCTRQHQNNFLKPISNHFLHLQWATICRLRSLLCHYTVRGPESVTTIVGVYEATLQQSRRFAGSGAESRKARPRHLGELGLSILCQAYVGSCEV